MKPSIVLLLVLMSNLSRNSIKNRYPESKAIARAARVTLSGMQFTGAFPLRRRNRAHSRQLRPAI
jgi:hypothetical protein